MRQLPIPVAAERDSDSVEMMRAWIAEHGLQSSLNAGGANGVRPALVIRDCLDQDGDARIELALA